MTDTTLWERFSEVAAAAATRTAVHDTDRTWTYAELQTRAEAIGALLDERDAGDRVACMLAHGGEMIAGVLGVLAGGRAYVPLDPTHPADRTAFVFADSGARGVLVDRAHADLAARLLPDASVIRTDEARAGLRPRARPRADDLAYCLYTSGSTGRPKGVLQAHGHVVRLLDAYARRLGLD
ncbi:MAG TPA: AMP-binding protein, partial [Kofleriaceae bacterium]|nr:AMP-binding protein [Kofleriaceae bacterium]